MAFSIRLYFNTVRPKLHHVISTLQGFKMRLRAAWFNVSANFNVACLWEIVIYMLLE